MRMCTRTGNVSRVRGLRLQLMCLLLRPRMTESNSDAQDSLLPGRASVSCSSGRPRTHARTHGCTRTRARTRARARAHTHTLHSTVCMYTQIMAFFVPCVWLVPFGFFVSCRCVCLLLLMCAPRQLIGVLVTLCTCCVYTDRWICEHKLCVIRQRAPLRTHCCAPQVSVSLGDTVLPSGTHSGGLGMPSEGGKWLCCSPALTVSSHLASPPPPGLRLTASPSQSRPCPPAPSEQRR